MTYNKMHTIQTMKTTPPTTDPMMIPLVSGAALLELSAPLPRKTDGEFVVGDGERTDDNGGSEGVTVEMNGCRVGTGVAGAEDGLRLGSLLGTLLGDALGDAVGSTDGSTDGDELGLTVGDLVTVGDALGAELGDGDGSEDGNALGILVGV